MGWTELYWAIMALLGSTRLYWAVLDFTGRYWALLLNMHKIENINDNGDDKGIALA